MIYDIPVYVHVEHLFLWQYIMNIQLFNKVFIAWNLKRIWMSNVKKIFYHVYKENIIHTDRLRSWKDVLISVPEIVKVQFVVISFYLMLHTCNLPCDINKVKLTQYLFHSWPIPHHWLSQCFRWFHYTTKQYSSPCPGDPGTTQSLSLGKFQVLIL